MLLYIQEHAFIISKLKLWVYYSKNLHFSIVWSSVSIEASYFNNSSVWPSSQAQEYRVPVRCHMHTWFLDCQYTCYFYLPPNQYVHVWSTIYIPRPVVHVQLVTRLGAQSSWLHFSLSIRLHCPGNSCTLSAYRCQEHWIGFDRICI